jgi:hypothetical protein
LKPEGPALKLQITNCQLQIHSAFSSDGGGEYVEQLNYGWAYGDENQGGHYEQDEGDNHFDGRFSGLFFGALAALGAQGIGMHAQGLGNAGSEAVGLNQGCYQRANVIYSGALGQIAERLDARFSGASFEVEEMEFSAQFGVGVA